MRQSRLKVGNLLFEFLELAIHDPAIFGAAGVIDSAAKVAGLELEPFDFFHLVGFRIVHLTHTAPLNVCLIVALQSMALPVKSSATAVGWFVRLHRSQRRF
jgi:hypothetical protein